MQKKYFITWLIFCVFIFFISVSSILAQDKSETLEGEVVRILEQKQIVPQAGQKKQLYQELEILVTKGSLKDNKIVVKNGSMAMSNLNKYERGDELVIKFSKNYNGEDSFFITDYIRRPALVWLLAIFVTTAILIGGWQGLTSLLGMVVSFGVIFMFILPQIALGKDPVGVVVIGSLAIIPATFLLSHGVNKKTGIAILGTLISLVITGFFAHFFVNTAKLTGFASEEAGFLQVYNPGLINMKGLLLAGIIIGLLGVLDDITISQAAIVAELKATDTKLAIGDLYKKAMRIGKDHIASMINTLVLVYTGAALPLLLLFINNPHSFLEVINYEIIADEVVRTLVGSIGLMLAVPITTIIACILVENNDKKNN